MFRVFKRLGFGGFKRLGFRVMFRGEGLSSGATGPLVDDQ